MLNLPEQGYTPANYAALVKLTSLSNVDFYETFDIPKGTFEKHKSGSRTMKWQDWQQLLKQVDDYLNPKHLEYPVDKPPPVEYEYFLLKGDRYGK